MFVSLGADPEQTNRNLKGIRAQTWAVEVAKLKPICQKVSEVRPGSVERVCLFMARAEERSKLIRRLGEVALRPGHVSRRCEWVFSRGVRVLDSAFSGVILDGGAGTGGCSAECFDEAGRG